MTYKKKLIEVALPLEAINREAAREKSIRHGHPSTLHLWWARRPLAACRAVLFASLVDDPSAWPERFCGEEGQQRERRRLHALIEELVKWENSNNDKILNAARFEIARSVAWGRGEEPPSKPDQVLAYLAKHAPPVYDPFCGGGSIPLEAQRLGLEAHASDLNPVPVLINKALIEIPPRFAGKPPVNPESRRKLGASGSWKGAAGLAEDIRYYGQWMRNEAEKRIGHLYPKVIVVQQKDGSYRHATPSELSSNSSTLIPLTVIAWLWARTVASPNPAARGAHVPLVRSFWLSTKAGKKAWVEPVVDQSTMTYRFAVRTGVGEPRAGTVSRNGGVCLLTGSPMPLEYVRAEGKAGRISSRLMAMVAEGPGGRTYLPPTDDHERIARSADPHDVPDTDLPEQALGFRVQNYGMTKHRHLFTQRQLKSLTTFCDLVTEVRARITADGAGEQCEYADAVATYLGLAVGRLSDICNALCRWEVTKTQVRNLFTRQAIAMLWDFAEPNVFSETAGDYSISLGNLLRALEHLPARGQTVLRQLNAETLMNDQPRLFSTDPPYYDNVPYADLSDFFYVWLRRCLQPVHPELLGTMLVPKAEELIAEPFRHGGKEEARSFFERGMGRVFQRMREASDARFPTTIYYAFKQAEDEEESDDDTEEAAGARASTGWETFLQGLADAGWQIDGTWPMRTELGNRMRNLASNALASSIVLVCRPRPKHAGVASRRDFLAALKRELPEALRNLQKGNIAPVDLAQAAIGPGMAVFSRYAKVLETDGSPMGVRTALTLINQSLDEVLAEQEGEFDADTRWAIAWFDQFGFDEGAYGVAETLSKAKNTSISGMVEAGILAAKGGKVRLLKRDELAADWDPATDTRLTIWEITHHLIRRLEQGESAAASLLGKLGGKGEIARDLSYRLYTLCERRKRAQDAIAYNSLVLAWPDILRLSQEPKATGPSQREMQL